VLGSGDFDPSESERNNQYESGKNSHFQSDRVRHHLTIRLFLDSDPEVIHSHPEGASP